MKNRSTKRGSDFSHFSVQTFITHQEYVFIRYDFATAECDPYQIASLLYYVFIRNTLYVLRVCLRQTSSLSDNRDIHFRVFHVQIYMYWHLCISCSNFASFFLNKHILRK